MEEDAAWRRLRQGLEVESREKQAMVHVRALYFMSRLEAWVGSNIARVNDANSRPQGLRNRKSCSIATA